MMLKKLITILVISISILSFGYVVGSFNGMCPYLDENGYILEDEKAVASFSSDGKLINFALRENMFDALGEIVFSIDKKLFLAEKIEKLEDGLKVYGRAGTKPVQVIYTLNENVLNIRIYGKDMKFLRVLIQPCSFYPVIIRERSRSFIQGRDVAYGFVSKGSMSLFTAGKLVMASRNVGKDENGTFFDIGVYISKDIDSILRQLGNESAKSYVVLYSNGKPAAHLKLILKDGKKAVDVATTDGEGRITFSVAAKSPSFSTIYNSEIYVEKVEGNFIYLNVSPRNTFRWRPYLSNLGYDHVTVGFRTYTPCKARVVLDNGKEFTDNVVDTFHSITLTGLKPNTEYTAKVKACEMTSAVSFRTFGSKNFKFLVYGDTRTNEDWHELVTKAMAKEKPLFVLHSGDLVESGDLIIDWDKFFGASKDLYSIAPLFPSLGNHERNSELYYQAFLEPYGGGDFYRRWYSFDVENVHVVILDSTVTPGTVLDESQKEWLANDLKRASGKIKIVVFHYPFFTNTPNREPNYREDWEEIFKKYKVDVVFNGHLHHYERFYKDGIMYVTTGGGGAPLGFGLLSSRRKNLPWTEAGEAGYLHYVVGEVTEKGIKFTVKAVAKYNWGNLERLNKILDEFFIEAK